ncbi:MAG: outer membrane protein transport protein [Deltaproteobacteria bacterium]|nr:outer membrane protein transport protein [Deltaproteobacteria bacterium]
MAVAPAISSRAVASPVEVFGFGSRHAAMAGTGVASTDDFAAVYYNPAGLAVGTGTSASFGVQGAVSNLSIDDRRQALTDPVGVVLGLVAPAPLGGPLANRLRLGLGMYILPTSIARVRAHFPDEPFFPWYDNRIQRLVILPGAAVRVSSAITVGAAVNVLAGLGGGIQASEGATRALEARVDEKVPTVARLHAGVTFAPTAALRFGAVYRQRFEVPFATAAKTEVAGEPINLDLRASGQFTPDQVAIGGAWSGSGATVALDLNWSNWSAYPGPFVAVQSELPLVGPLAATLPDVPYKDTFAVRTGGELALGTTILRAGYAFETSPFPARQTGVTNLLDGPKHTIGVGIGFVMPKAAGGKDLRVDLHAQTQVVGHRTITKTIYSGDGTDYDSYKALRDEVTDNPNDPATLGAQISNPGYPGLESGGQVFSAGVTVEVQL